MITSEKIFDTLEEARAWGEYIAQSCDWKYIGAEVRFRGNGNTAFSPKWRY